MKRYRKFDVYFSLNPVPFQLVVKRKVHIFVTAYLTYCSYLLYGSISSHLM